MEPPGTEEAAEVEFEETAEDEEEDDDDDEEDVADDFSLPDERTSPGATCSDPSVCGVEVRTGLVPGKDVIANSEDDSQAQREEPS